MRTLLLAFLLLAPAPAGADEPLVPTTPTKQERNDYIRRGRIFTPTDVASQDLYNGPPGELQYAVNEELTCDFVPKPLTGLTDKFLCKLDDGRVFRVKYNEGERFKETYGEVLGTRLFHALGFYADKVLPVRVTCRNCPKHPWKYVRKKKSKPYLDADGMVTKLPPEAEVGTHTFDPATIEEPMDVAAIERKKRKGWSWKSLKTVDPAAGGATQAEIDALELLMAFVQNSDNKSKQNALACPREELMKDETGRVVCRQPILYVDDLGSVFGKGGFVTGYSARTDYEGWKKRAVWRDPEHCRARLIAIGGIFRPGTLHDPRIGEEGRALLAQQLGALSDQQIADLFRAGRIEGLHQTIEIENDGNDDEREVTVEDWVALFKLKREQITSHPGCEERHDDAPAARP